MLQQQLQVMLIIVSLSCSAAQTAKAAMHRGQGLKPVLQHIYETRARSYRDAVQEFVEGYKEGYVGEPITKADNRATDDKTQNVLKAEPHNAEPAEDISHLQRDRSRTEM